ncbi:MAG: 50S ribosomal protein L7/L12 [Candidatus Gottesmanbacteria bacterium GW2011_GWC2_39_8]|uniref:Large ribosomal subunit protein bL12 n=1 Tax=Candidatus Gottesmanbacteria bacterium GW2011_GWC2_39_8 TaxID=1618450 RepID=A0A0G0SWD9_9BACT|nr:MAG: 50S ribosomal protein L7/L12 [Candidatus Gottesmanbacteria bacterium GW2011_GWC2_39_8]
MICTFEFSPLTFDFIKGGEFMAKLTKDEMLTAVEEMTVLELADFVKALEDKFGVSAAPVAVAPSASSGQAPAGEAAPEQTSFNVVLTAAGANKIGAIKAVRELVPTLGLQEAKALVESAPKEVLTGVNKKTAEEAKAKLTAAGATVELK